MYNLTYHELRILKTQYIYVFRMTLYTGQLPSVNLMTLYYNHIVSSER